MKAVPELLSDLIRIPSVSTLSNISVIDYIASGMTATTVSFGTEAPYFNQLGAETVVFGPVDMKVAHRSGEHVSLVELEGATDLLVQVIRKLCG